jgi:hypothetical protein
MYSDVGKERGSRLREARYANSPKVVQKLFMEFGTSTPKLPNMPSIQPPPTEVGGFCACRLKPTGVPSPFFMTRRLILKQASQGPQSLHASELPMLYRSYFALSDTTSACGTFEFLFFLPTAQCAASSLKPSPKGERLTPRQVTNSVLLSCIRTCLGHLQATEWRIDSGYWKHFRSRKDMLFDGNVVRFL